MSREVSVPTITMREEIQMIQEVPSTQSVRVTVGFVDGENRFLPNQIFNVYVVAGDMYDELVGPPQTWNPNKPIGTYANDDLWHFVDLLRAIPQVLP